jgi:hypothetical protein
VTAVDARILKLAEDVGRLRRRVRDERRDGSYFAFLGDRVADHIDALDAMLEPTAAEWVAAGLSVEHALETVDERVRTLQSLLGGNT